MSVKVGEHTYITRSGTLYVSDKLIVVGTKWRKLMFKLPFFLRELLKHLFWRKLSQEEVERSIEWLLEHEIIHMVLDQIDFKTSDAFDRIWEQIQTTKPFIIGVET